MKKCPFCKEDIQDEAIKCRHCGEFLNKQGSPLAKPQTAPTPETRHNIYGKPLPPLAPSPALTRQGVSGEHANRVYKQSPLYLGILLGLDFILCFFIIGFFTGIAHILRYISTSITLTQTSVRLNSGAIIKNTIEIPYSRINTVSVKSPNSFFGDVVILAGNDSVGQVFKGMKNPEHLRAALMARVG